MINDIPMWSEGQAIELFHLIFVAHLGRRVDKALFAIKTLRYEVIGALERRLS